MNCENCGMKIFDGEKFCRYCGTPVNNEQQQQKSKKPVNKKMLIPVVTAVAVVLAGIIALSIYLSSTKVEREMGKALDSGDYDSVVQTFFELDEDGKRYEAKEAIREFIKEATDTLNNEFSFSVDGITDANEIEDELIDAFAIFCTNRWGNLFFDYNNDYGGFYYFGVLNDVDELYGFYEMCKSKYYYYAGQYYMNSATMENYDNYYDAVEEFLSVLKNDTNYSDAQEKATDALNKFVDAFITLADGYIAEGDFSSAMELLEEASNYIDEELTEYGYTYSETISTKIEETRKSYAAQYAAKAEEAFKNGDVNAAIGNIEAAIAIYPNGEYETKLSEYQLYLPYALYTEANCLNIEEKGDIWGPLCFDRNNQSNDNREMSHVIEWYKDEAYYHDSDSSASIIANYNLAGKFDTVSGVIFLPRNSRDTSFTGYFEAYGDGKLIYTSPKITAGVLPQDINFSVTGVQRLQIAFHGQGTGRSWPSGLRFGVSNLVAQKNIPQ